MNGTYMKHNEENFEEEYKDDNISLLDNKIKPSNSNYTPWLKESYQRSFSLLNIQDTSNISSCLDRANTNNKPKCIEKSLAKELPQQQSPATNEELELLKGYLTARFVRRIETVENIQDIYPLLEFRKALMRIIYSISELSLLIINASMFETLTILVILMNTIVLALEDPNGSPPSTLQGFDNFFLYFYTVECALKIIAYGFLLNKNSYLRDNWNILDFIIVVSGWAGQLAGSGVNLSAMRTLRILRPLRSISSVAGMRALFISLLYSIKPLLSALVVLFFYTLIFAIAALQLWSGALNYKCMDFDTGYYDNNSDTCGQISCPGAYVCVKVLDNPNYGTTNFDNIFISIIMVFQVITLEGWTQILVLTQKAFSYFSILYFMPLVFIGANLILNLALAIITSSFFTAMQQVRDKKDNQDFIKLEIEDFKENVSDEVLYKKIEKVRDSVRLTGMMDKKGIQNEGQMEIEHKYSEQKVEIMDDTKNKIDYLFSKVNHDDNYLFTQGNYIPTSFSPGLQGRNTDNCEIFAEKDDQVASQMQKLRKIKSILMLKREKTSVGVDKPKSIIDIKIEVNPFCILSQDSKDDVLSSYEKTQIKSGYNFLYVPGIEEKMVNDNLSKYAHVSEDDIKHFIMSYKGPHLGFKMLKGYVKDEVLKVQFHDSLQKNILGKYSGNDVFESLSYIIYIEKLNCMSYHRWSPGLKGIWEKCIFPVSVIMKSKHISTIMIILVLINTGCLASDHYGITDRHSYILQTINNILTYIFAVELFLRCITYGFYEFCRDKMNYFDTIVVVLSLIELVAFSNSKTSTFSAFRAIRVFRIFRVLRVVRILRYLESMGQIIRAVSKSLSNFMYLFLLLALFLIIFSLLGMQIFGGEFSFPQGLPRGNFDSFHWAFVTTFILLSTENWNDILTSSMRSSIGPASSLFLIFWIILGNFVILNLFLAILLESFSTDEEEDEIIYEDNDIEREYKMLTRINRKVKRKLQVLINYENPSDSENDESSEADNFSKQTKEKTILNDMDDNQCYFSYMIFSKNNKIRIACFKLIKDKKFDMAILALITLNSLKLVWDTYMIDHLNSDPEVQVSMVMDYIFTFCFFVEFITKSIALGFFYDEGTYLTDNWNKLDLLIIILSILDTSVSSINIPIIKIFRLLRTLRPLRLINHNLSMKIVVIALVESLSAIVNVLAVILVIWLIYSILGVSLLGGKMYKCSNSLIELQIECENSGYIWLNTNTNFDNVLYGMITLFIVMSQESWPNRMYEGVDAREISISPQVNYNPYMAYFYIGYLIIGNFFMVNLFTAVVFNKFNEAKINESSISSLILSKGQKIWTDLQQLIIESKPVIEIKHIPTNKISHFCHAMTKSRAFEFSIMAAIIINLIVLAMPYEGAPLKYLIAIENMNLALTVVFLCEACLKIIGSGVKRYLADKWNRIDFFIVVTSIVDLCFQIFAGTSITLLRQGPQLIRIIRVMRVSRLFRLVKTLESLQTLMMIIAYALPAIMNVLALLLLIFFIFSILGVFLFHNVDKGNAINEFYNFKNFSNGMNVLWRISTGEDYPSIMFDCANYLDSEIYIIYFLSFITLIDFVILDLFISVIIQNYEEYSTNSDTALKKFHHDIKIFRKIWGKYTADTNGIRISREFITDFFEEFGKEFGIFDERRHTIESIKKATISLTVSINTDQEGNFYYHDVLFAMLKKKYSTKITRIKSEYTRKILMMEESKTQNELGKLRKKAIRNFDKKSQSMKKCENFFVQTMYLKSVLRSWREYTKRKKQKNRSISITPQFSDIEYPGQNSEKN
ncbi:hypothetical protein SteCoe_34530 [Stentor coeruleus]|uniref:Ion transport domain-containing protein n=1 Tax=Stentor coeruleus TaxID=5963 RepID=A0A1R2AUA6_9CILI|nr:hypothetical protein SteCoe_34530 [Stentor coeruleus]